MKRTILNSKLVIILTVPKKESNKNLKEGRVRRVGRTGE